MCVSLLKFVRYVVYTVYLLTQYFVNIIPNTNESQCRRDRSRMTVIRQGPFKQRNAYVIYIIMTITSYYIIIITCTLHTLQYQGPPKFSERRSSKVHWESVSVCRMCNALGYSGETINRRRGGDGGVRLHGYYIII